MSAGIVPNFPANPTIIMPVHGEFGFGESPVSWAAWVCLHADDYAEANRLFCLHNDVLVHRIRQNNGRAKPAGSTVGSDNGQGYLQIKFKGGPVKVHHLVWLLTYGHWPRHPLVLDHKNGIKDDNRISNLREVTQQFNVLLGKRMKSGSTLPFGVSIVTVSGGKDTYARATIRDPTGKHHHHYININDPSTREAAIATCAAWWVAKHAEFFPRLSDYHPNDIL